MLTNDQREQIVEIAKTWLGTPYRGHTRIKGVGCDCGMLLAGIYMEAGLLPEDIDLPTDYSLQVSQHRASTEYIDLVDKYFDSIDEADVQPGDLVVYRLGKAFAHAAVIVSWPDYIIQAEAHHGVSGGHGTKTPIFRHAPRVFRTFRTNPIEDK